MFIKEFNKLTVPHIALVVSDRESNASIQSCRPDLLEIRVDQFRKLTLQYLQDNLKKRHQTRLPLILTIRNQVKEGGQRKISDKLKQDLFEAGIDFVQAIDIELSSPLLKPVVKLAKKKKKTIIISVHNFQITPTRPILEKILKTAKRQGADIVKIAAHAKSQDDFIRLLEFTIRHRKDKVITLSMGKLGSISRLLFPVVGSILTYSFIGKPFAPGQIPIKTLQEHFRFYYS